MSDIREIDPKTVVVGDRLIQLDEKVVVALMKSITEVGQINPITVHGVGVPPVPHLVTGLHRLEACKRLKRNVRVASGPSIPLSSAIDDHYVNTEVSENLVRREFTAEEKGILALRRSDAIVAANAAVPDKVKKTRAVNRKWKAKKAGRGIHPVANATGWMFPGKIFTDVQKVNKSTAGRWIKAAADDLDIPIAKGGKYPKAIADQLLKRAIKLQMSGKPKKAPTVVTTPGTKKKAPPATGGTVTFTISLEAHGLLMDWIEAGKFENEDQVILSKLKRSKEHGRTKG